MSTPPDWFVLLMGVGMLGGLVYVLELVADAVRFLHGRWARRYRARVMDGARS